jgi:hypothetical protein
MSAVVKRVAAVGLAASRSNADALLPASAGADAMLGM